MPKPDWIAAARQGAKVALWEISGPNASPCAALPYAEFEAWARRQTLPIIACGLDTHPSQVPCTPLDAVVHVETALTIAALPQLAQSQPAAKSQGAEAALAGYLGQDADFEGVLCVVSQETLWAQISAGEVVSFQSFLTPELITHLGGELATGDGFDAALSDSLAQPSALARHLSSARILGQPGAIAGHLIGAELAAAKPYWLGQEVVVIAQTPAPYVSALALQGLAPRQARLDEMTLAGLRRAYELAMA